MKKVEKIPIPCLGCGKLRMIDKYKISYEKYLERYPLCRKCKANTEEFKNKVSKGWFKKGVPSWSNGLKRPDHIPWNKDMKGIHLSPDSEFKKGQTSKEKNINWMGGITTLRNTIRHLQEYKKWRKLVFERDNFTCQICNIRGGKLHADHINPFSVILQDNTIKTIEDALLCKELWDIENGRCLCKGCHSKTETYGSKMLIKLKELYG